MNQHVQLMKGHIHRTPSLLKEIRVVMGQNSRQVLMIMIQQMDQRRLHLFMAHINLNCDFQLLFKEVNYVVFRPPGMDSSPG